SGCLSPKGLSSCMAAVFGPNPSPRKGPPFRSACRFRIEELPHQRSEFHELIESGRFSEVLGRLEFSSLALLLGGVRRGWDPHGNLPASPALPDALEHLPPALFGDAAIEEDQIVTRHCLVPVHVV